MGIFDRFKKNEGAQVPPPEEYTIGGMKVTLSFGEGDGNATIRIAGGSEDERDIVSSLLHLGLEQNHSYHFSTGEMNDGVTDIRIIPPQRLSRLTNPLLTDERIKEVLVTLAENMPDGESLIQKAQDFWRSHKPDEHGTDFRDRLKQNPDRGGFERL